MSSIMAVALFVVSQAVLGEKPMSYHDQLLAWCDEAAAPACCRASAKAMRREQARVFDSKVGCPQGTERTSLACPASLEWCTRNKQEHKDLFIEE